MFPDQLSSLIKAKSSFLCVGLDTDVRRIPEHLHSAPDPIFAFNKAIIDATLPFAVAYKPNLAFYEAAGPKGWESLKKTLDYLPKDVFTIADAKRGDIGNTAKMYAKTFFETYSFDSVTVSPYMGKDAVTPFLEQEGKWAFVLGLTSNAGAADFQYHCDGKEMLYERVLRMGQTWDNEYPGDVGFVVGATKTNKMAEIRTQAPNSFFLVPGIGAQGGDLHAVCQHGVNSGGGLLINSSRGIIYASQGANFAHAAGEAAAALQQEMAPYT
ncbi:MAG: orotidine-5'-phosphate decarboxylase [Bacteroidota bacterium]